MSMHMVCSFVCVSICALRVVNMGQALSPPFVHPFSMHHCFIHEGYEVSRTGTVRVLLRAPQHKM